MKSLIDLHEVSFFYPTTPERMVLQGIDLQVDEGEFVALVGANGSGKSTLLRLTAGLLNPSQGEVKIAGCATHLTENQVILHTTLGMVFQYPEDQIVGTTVEEDIAFGLENLGWQPEEMRKRVDEMLNAVDLQKQRYRPSHLLSAGQTQRLALAGVLAPNPHLLLFDEATTMLDPCGRKELMARMKQLHQNGVTIIMVTHHMEEAAQAQRMVVLYQGKIAADGDPQSVFSQISLLKQCGLAAPDHLQLAAMLQPYIPGLSNNPANLEELLKALKKLPPGNSIPVEERKSCLSESKAPAIQVEALNHIYKDEDGQTNITLRNVSLQVMQNCSHSLLGATGSGKSTLMLNMMGLEKPQEGRIQIGDVVVTDKQTKMRDILKQVGMVFQNPEIQFFEQYAGDEVAYGAIMQGLDHEEVVHRVRWAMEIVGLDFEAFKDRMTFSLSGGERRKLALASTLVLQTPILLLDEPTAGLDPSSRKEIIQRLHRMRQDGRTLLLSTHDLNDVAALTENTTIMDGGKVAFSGSTRQAFWMPEMVNAAGLDIPAAAQVAQVMCNAGWLLPEGIITISELESCLAGSGSEVVHA
jgi:energy-coupling factor transport system ATP-binding protein